MSIESEIRKRFQALGSELNERGRRLFAASEANVLGRGGISAVSRATGISRRAIYVGLNEIGKPPLRGPDGRRRVRRVGGGRRALREIDPALPDLLETLVEPTARGDPGTNLRWVSKSLRHLSAEMTTRGHPISHVTVRDLLREMDYSIQGNSKEIEGIDHPDRDAQFQYINRQVKLALRTHQPAISVDTKKKELIGNFKAVGKEWRPKASPIRVLTHDFMIKKLGKVSPYGIYDIANNIGWVSLGITHDTAEFAVATIRRWWKKLGSRIFEKPKYLLIMADSGGSNGYRVRLWKVELQKLANKIGVPIRVCHFPPGTSKWNKIEHRLFSFISKNWRGRPLISHVVMIKLIASTTTESGLKVRCELDPKVYTKGIKISKKALQSVNLVEGKFHGEWNYTISPGDN